MTLATDAELVDAYSIAEQMGLSSLKLFVVDAPIYDEDSDVEEDEDFVHLQPNVMDVPSSLRNPVYIFNVVI